VDIFIHRLLISHASNNAQFTGKDGFLRGWTPGESGNRVAQKPQYEALSRSC
jgi:hypothetical protein